MRRRIMHGKRRKRSSCLKKKKIEGYFGGDIEPVENYQPANEEKYDPTKTAASQYQQKDMNIEREK